MQHHVQVSDDMVKTILLPVVSKLKDVAIVVRRRNVERFKSHPASMIK